MRRSLHLQFFSAIGNGLGDLQDILGQSTVRKALGWRQFSGLARLQFTSSNHGARHGRGNGKMKNIDPYEFSRINKDQSKNCLA